MQQAGSALDASHPRKSLRFLILKSRSLRLKDPLGPVTRVKKKKKAEKSPNNQVRARGICTRLVRHWTHLTLGKAFDSWGSRVEVRVHAREVVRRVLLHWVPPTPLHGGRDLLNLTSFGL